MRVENGSMLPNIRAELDGASVDLSEVVAGSWGVALLYRGHW